MTSTTYSPSIDQGAKLIFETNFYKLMEHSKSKLASTSAIKYLPSGGKTNNMGRIGRTELVEVTASNPDKQYADISLDNRQFTKSRFTRTITIDAKTNINELITDPTSDILMKLNAAKERVIDKVISNAAVGSVLVGQPDATPSSISAATDGVLTVDATAGLTYDKIQEITQNFINNEFDIAEIQGAVFAITGAENTALMGEDQFINNDYISGYAVEQGYKEKAGIYLTKMFAGSVTGGISVANPVLQESTTTRKCIVLAPDAISISMELARLEVEKSASKVNSFDITIDFWIGAMRNEGAKVQIVTTTI